MSIQDELMRVLDNHSLMQWTSEERNRTTCRCGWQGNGFDLHRINAILARFAVVELPNRTDDRWSDGDEGCEMSGWEVETGPHYVSVWNKNEVQMSYAGHAEEPFDPTYARNLAAALLAAANQAEAHRKQVDSTALPTDIKSGLVAEIISQYEPNE